jgi:predicted RNA-binding Zn-ribbon protein involved in translation (DUF1610 family)
MVRLNYQAMKALFAAVESVTQETVHVEGQICFTEDSFDKTRDLAARTYVVTSNNAGYQANKNGSGVYGSSLDQSDLNIRLDLLMSDSGKTSGWEIESCYMREEDYAIAFEAYAQESLNSTRLEIMDSQDEKRICPRCGGKFTGHGAVSRHAENAVICPDCGTEEALLDLIGKPKKASHWWVLRTSNLMDAVIARKSR